MKNIKKIFERDMNCEITIPRDIYDEYWTYYKNGIVTF
jgi:hypothetical protein